MNVDIAADFSPTPGGRYSKHGPYSGQEFREKVLLPRMKDALERRMDLNVVIDTVRRSYQVSFLDEAFAGLIRDGGLPKDAVQKHLHIISSNPRFEKYRTLIQKYISSV
ncbi:STAS-like domain-containing protein [Roseibium aggregatum]|uniref:STAS-like domain-containing protein n=1 Tax=Roseibium aggregatum TaxID=187304 RepID=UPI001E63C34E|nr:DUF4325 domain-containing protein [Roseibium aggregatum]